MLKLNLKPVAGPENKRRLLATTNATNTTNSTNTTTPISNATEQGETGLKVNDSLTVATAPTISTATIISLPYSPDTNTFIGADVAQCMQLDSSSGTSTLVTAHYYDRISDTAKAPTLSLTGQYSYVASSSYTVSGILLSNNASP